MNNSTNQIFKDIDFLVDELGMTADQTNEILQACDELGGIGAEYFCEEFIFCPDESEEEDDKMIIPVQSMQVTTSSDILKGMNMTTISLRNLSRTPTGLLII